MDNYEEYYQFNDVLSLGDQRATYEEVIRRLEFPHPEILDRTKPMTFVLGGFHPGTSTPQDFINLFKKYHSMPDDKYIYLDMNQTPLQDESAKNNRLKKAAQTNNLLEKLDKKLFVQGRLEKPPFANNSIDWMVLDRTLDFMDDDKVRLFADKIALALRPSGIIMATIADPVFPFLANWQYEQANRVKQHTRTYGKLKGLVKDSLKTVFHGDAELDNGRNYSILAFSKKDSPLEEYQGMATDLTFEPIRTSS